MEKLIGHNFKLNKGEYVLIKPQKVSFENSMREIIGVIRNYDGINSQSGCFLNGWMNYKISGIVKEIKYPFVIAWYKGNFLLLSGDKLGLFDHKRKDTSDIEVNLFKLNKNDIKKFKSYILKTQIINAKFFREEENEKN